MHLPTLRISKDGSLWNGETQLQDEDELADFVSNLCVLENGAFASTLAGTPYLVFAEDEPLIGQAVRNLSAQGCEVQMQDQVFQTVAWADVTLDEWDRLHGWTAKSKVPFVLSRQGQQQLFDLVDSFDDDSFEIAGHRIPLAPWLSSQKPVEQAQFWTERYQQQDTGWDLAGPSPLLVNALKRLKLARSRVVVLGAGRGWDAAYFAEQGHLVTAIDFSSQAIDEAKSRLQNLGNLQFVQADVLQLSKDLFGQFDLVFEHTCYCAIQPSERARLAKVYHQLLTDQGQLLGIFFVNSKRGGPPFGGSEYELQKRFTGLFQTLWWERSLQSVNNRLGKELLFLGQKKEKGICR